MDNQFINIPLLRNQSVKIDSKDQTIRKLELKNNRLKSELIKIQRSIEEKFNQTEEDEVPRKRQSIFQSEDNYEVLTKQLSNTYKRIKMYEYEINKLEEGSHSSLNNNHYSLVIKEKKEMGDRLKHQLVKLKKSVDDNTRRLQKNNDSNQLESEIKKLNQQYKFYQQKLKLIEDRENMKSGNMKKQYEQIKKIENKLLQLGVAGGELQDLKRNAIKGITGNRREDLQKHKEEEQIQDRTREAFQVILGEVALLEKMQNDYEKQMIIAFDQKTEAINKNMTSRNRLLQCENQIENLEKEIQIMKGKVVPSNMKPLKPIRSFSSHQGQNPQKILPSKSLIASPLKKTTAKNKGLIHLLKYDQVGFPSIKGQRFTDRIIIGKNNLNLKITSIKVYIHPKSGLIAGIQCTYSGNKKGGDHIRKDKDQRQKQYKEEQFTCRGSSFVRSVAGTLTEDDRLQSIQFTTSDGTSFKVGIAKTIKKSFNLQITAEQFPTCIFGSLLVVKQPGQKQYSLIEHFGCELQGDYLNSHSTINEFDL